MKRSFLHIVLLSASILLADLCYAQERELRIADSLVLEKEVELAYKALEKIDTLKLNASGKAEYYFLYAKTLVLDNIDDKSFENFLEAKKQYLQLDSLAKVAAINMEIVQLLNATEYKNLNYRTFLDEYMAYAVAQNDPALLSDGYMQEGKCIIDKDSLQAIRYFKKALEENRRTTDTLMNAMIHHNLGVVYKNIKQFDAAFYHYDKALPVYEKYEQLDYISYIYINKAAVLKSQGKYDEAIAYYHKADSLPIKEYEKKNKALLYEFLSDAYGKKGDYAKAHEYLLRSNVYNDMLNEEEQIKAIAELDRKFNLSEKDREIFGLKKNQNSLLIILGIIALIALVAFLGMLNFRTKKRLAEQEKVLERQKVDQLLKEQELNSLDAMIEGQEKERQRIASDLHDNLGSLLATLKLHFQNLKVKKDRLQEEEDTLLKKTDDLIEEAYQKVRSIAHARNAGVPAREGLLPAVKNFASKVSLANKLIIEVVDHGMEERLENSLEITLFRIIQELITNVIKHARATESAIHLTHHKNNINIMVEDNGIGFDIAMVKPKEGMGLYSIQKRIEYLDGRVTIESIAQKGTTIIMDIPII